MSTRRNIKQIVSLWDVDVLNNVNVFCVCVCGEGGGGGGIINMLYVDEMTVGSLELKQ